MDELVAAVSSALGRPCTARSALPTGHTRGTCRLSDENGDLFVKTLPMERAEALRAEAEGLRLIAATDTFRVPAVFGLGQTAEQAWLALEWLDLRPVADPDHGRTFGRTLAALHATHEELYGLDRDNWLGDNPQPNGRSASWPQFFAQKRIAPLLDRLMDQGERGEFIRNLQAIVERIPALFLDYRPAPSLLHGDLWHGNAGMVGDRPAVFDPAVHFGDREADYAMTELFGGFPVSMYAAYQQAAPLDEGAASRRGLYRLHHLLNHLILFGNAYRRETERTAARLVSELR